MSASEAILKYLQQQNRPYSANDIFQNMHKEIGKTQLQKSLDQLVDQNKIKEKIYGKQKIYVIIQDNNSKENLEKEIKILDEKIEKISELLSLSDQEVKSKEVLVKQLNSMVSIEEAKANISELELSISKLQTKLTQVSENKIQIPPEEKEKILKNHNVIIKEWRKRKRTCMDIINSILENYPKSKKELLEEIGIETDEDANVKIPE